jgi:hypothetical protein
MGLLRPLNFSAGIFVVWVKQTASCFLHTNEEDEMSRSVDRSATLKKLTFDTSKLLRVIR